MSNNKDQRHDRVDYSDDSKGMVTIVFDKDTLRNEKTDSSSKPVTPPPSRPARQ
ncbi:hypothetical protein E05_47210 [Plautia stali symbiont]|nr:hypothetical protein E05_05900 [Plautia stali symbiont]BAN96995.1 hypothetical protein E05_22290 [Plautia stali symbiont]BAN98980.1 hypothetical protein E05_42140 [Plautia stali symbiont]BAN99487.1 hypothetical protein E05_47210 [Plautia stali symbiont]